jgi:hypothetical protein
MTMINYSHRTVSGKPIGLLFPLLPETTFERRSVNAWQRLARQAVTRYQELSVERTYRRRFARMVWWLDNRLFDP